MAISIYDITWVTDNVEQNEYFSLLHRFGMAIEDSLFDHNTDSLRTLTVEFEEWMETSQHLFFQDRLLRCFMHLIFSKLPLEGMVLLDLYILHADVRLFLNLTLSHSCDSLHPPLIIDNYHICPSDWFIPWTGQIRNTRWVNDLREIVWGLLDHHVFYYPYSDPGSMASEEELHYWTLGQETDLLYFQSITHTDTELEGTNAWDGPPTRNLVGLPLPHVFAVDNDRELWSNWGEETVVDNVLEEKADGQDISTIGLDNLDLSAKTI